MPSTDLTVGVLITGVFPDNNRPVTIAVTGKDILGLK